MGAAGAAAAEVLTGPRQVPLFLASSGALRAVLSGVPGRAFPSPRASPLVAPE